MVTVAIRAVGLEHLVKILDLGRSRSRYIFTDSDSTALDFFQYKSIRTACMIFRILFTFLITSFARNFFKHASKL
jgi:hypothetical protein